MKTQDVSLAGLLLLSSVTSTGEDAGGWRERRTRARPTSANCIVHSLIKVPQTRDGSHAHACVDRIWGGGCDVGNTQARGIFIIAHRTSTGNAGAPGALQRDGMLLHNTPDLVS